MEKKMDTESSSQVSKVINEIRSVFGFEEAIVQFMIEIGQKTETTAEEFYLRSKEFLPRIPLKCILSIFDTIRENFPQKPKNSPARSDFPEVGKIYGGKVISVKKMACFVRLDGFSQKVQGLIFDTNIGDGKFTDLKPTTNVFVKVLSISDKDSLTLSTKGVDQKTGQDLETTEGIKRESLNPETIRIEINDSLKDFLRLRIECGHVVSPVSQQQKQEVLTDVKLYCLGAIDEKMKSTVLGEKMAKFSVGPVLSRILMAGVDFQCGHEVLSIVAMMVTGSLFFKRPDEEERRVEADRKMAGFFRPGGDLLTLLAVFEAWEENGVSAEWCLDNFVCFESLKRAKELRNKLVKTMNRMGLEIISTDKDNPMIRKAITAGLFSQSAKWDQQEYCYRPLVNENRTLHIHPRSALFREERPRFVVHDAIRMGDDNKEYMIRVTVIDPKWLIELVPRYFREAGPTRTAAMSQQEIRGLVEPIPEPKSTEPKSSTGV